MVYQYADIEVAKKVRHGRLKALKMVNLTNRYPVSPMQWRYV